MPSWNSPRPRQGITMENFQFKLPLIGGGKSATDRAAI
jgi:hypothetical protein